MAGYSKEHLRSIVREALKEAVSGGNEQHVKPKRSMSALERKLRSAMASGNGSLVSVDVSNRYKFNEFIKELTAIAQDGAIQSAIVNGKLIFDAGHPRKHISRATAPVNNIPENSGSGDFLYEKGMLTESKIVGIAKHHQRVIIGKGVVVTPLARDRARTVKLKIVRQEQ